MNRGQARYWLLTLWHYNPVADEREVTDFVCCEVPIRGEAAIALEVFTSRESAEAELRGMKRLASGRYLRAEEDYGDRMTNKMLNDTDFEEVVELAAPELVEMLKSSSIPYVLVDPPPVDKPIPHGLRIEFTPAFMEGVS
jgi:glutathionyl-hydroquinone reductase